MKKAWILLFIFLFSIAEAQSLTFFAVIKPGKQAILNITTGNENISISYTPCYKIFIATHQYYGCPQTYEEWLGDIDFNFTLAHNEQSNKGTINFCGTELSPGEVRTETIIITTPSFEVNTRTIWVVLEDKDDPGTILQTKCESIKVYAGSIVIDWWEILTNPWVWLGVIGTSFVSTGAYVVYRAKKIKK